MRLTTRDVWQYCILWEEEKLGLGFNDPELCARHFVSGLKGIGDPREEIGRWLAGGGKRYLFIDHVFRLSLP